MQRALKSSKFQAMLAGLITIILIAVINRQQIDPNVLSAAVTGLIGAYIAATAYEDGQKAKAEVAPTTTITTPGGSDVSVTAPDGTGVPPQPIVLGRLS